MTKRVLIAGQERDPHVGAVLDEIVARGGRPLFLDRFLTPRVGVAVGPIPGQPHCLIGEVEDGKIADFSDVHAVWNRLKPLFANREVRPPTFCDWDAAQFWINEWRAFDTGVMATIGAAKWVNPLENRALYDNKIWQLATAQRLGLCVPATVIGNDAEQILSRIESEWLIYKPLTFTPLADGKVIYANRVHRSQISDQADLILGTPGIFQEYVEKAYELRAIAVGGRIFSARINSQERTETKVDWRKFQDTAMYEAVELDIELTDKLLAFMGESNLRFGAFDLVRTPDDRHVFLECNSAGQWLWLNRWMDLPVAAALAEEFLS